ncbi:MAG: aminopeptidase, partial [Betaproteobacteria bacterium]|nr:aminopeptidase [Betaproteobacteria bacterium]
MKKTPELVYSPQSAWERYSSPGERRAMDVLAARYLDFLTKCKTERETVDHALHFLQNAGYKDSFKSDLVVRPFRGKALFVARRGTLPLNRGLHLLSAHADAPRLDLKQRPLVEQTQVLQAKTHYYGGIHKYQWLARPLALHGVLIRQDGSRVEVTLGEDPADPVFAIADLLPHLAGERGGQKISEGFAAEKLNIILGHCPELKGGKDKDSPKEPVKQHILGLLSKKYKMCEEDFISAELQAVP